MFSAKQLVLCIKQTHWKRPWCWERLRAGERGAEDEMIRKHHQLDGHEFNQTLGDSEGQKSLVSYSPCGRKDSDKTERLNNNLFYKIGFYILDFLLFSPPLKLWHQRCIGIFPYLWGDHSVGINANYWFERNNKSHWIQCLLLPLPLTQPTLANDWNSF